jgi:hypothetical protein
MIKGSLKKAAHYRLRINPIAGKLVSTRAYFLFRLISAYYELLMKKSPTIFQYITKMNLQVVLMTPLSVT